MTTTLRLLRGEARPPRWERLPRMSQAGVALRRLVAQRLGLRPSAAAAVTAALGKVVGVPVAVEAGEAWAIGPEQLPRLGLGAGAVIELALPDGKPLAVIADAGLVLRLLQHVMGRPPELAAPRPLTGGERGVLFGLTALVAETVGVNVRVLAVHESVAALKPGEAWLVGQNAEVRLGGVPGTLRLVCGESALEGAAARLRLGEGEKAWLGELGRRVSVIAGTTRLTAIEARELEEGDVILLPGARPSKVFIKVGRGSFAAELEGASMKVVAPWRQGEPMSQDVDEAYARELTVPLTVRLAQLELSLRELVELGSGVVLALGKPLGSGVDLCAGERVVARGELVEIEGELGVKINELVR